MSYEVTSHGGTLCVLFNCYTCHVVCAYTCACMCFLKLRKKKMAPESILCLTVAAAEPLTFQMVRLAHTDSSDHINDSDITFLPNEPLRGLICSPGSLLTQVLKLSEV